MRRFAALTLSVLAVLAAAVSAGAADKPLSVRLSACHRGVAAVDRYLQTTSTVRLVPGARKVVLHYELLWRHGGAGAFTRYPAPAFERSFAKASEHVYTVGSLPAPASYRLRVIARWKRGARVLRQEQHVTGTCHQPDLRPDLTVARFVKTARGRFDAVIRNVGGGPAGAFSAAGVQFAGLKAGRAVRVSVKRCTTVTVDPDNRVAERDEDNNSASSPCSTG